MRVLPPDEKPELFLEILSKICIQDLPNSLRIRMPSDSGRKAALSRVICKSFARFPNVVVWIRSVSVWPSSGHLPLFFRLRQAWGVPDTSEIEGKYEFLECEFDDAASLVLIGLMFFWDFVVFDHENNIIFNISHDEHYDVWVRSPEMDGSIFQRFSSGKWGSILSETKRP